MKPTALTRVAVVIPALNEAGTIGRCLASLKAQEQVGVQLDIIVVDNGSTDDTAIIAESMGVRVVSAPGARIGRVRNLGVQAADSPDVIAFIDADCEAPPGWLLSSLSYFADPSIGAVGGYFRLPAQRSWVEEAWAPDVVEANVSVGALATGSCFVRGDLFRALEGFNEQVTAGEDTEFSGRLVKRGCRLLRCSEASVIHYGYPNELKGFFFRQVWQSSNYLQTRKAGFDAMFAAVVISLAALIGLVVAVFCLSAGAAAVFMVAFMGVVGVVTLHRMRGVPSHRWLKQFVIAYPIHLMYIIARIYGLILSCLGMQANRWQK